MSGPNLASETHAVVSRVWAGRLGLPVEAFEAHGLVFVGRSDLTAAVVVRLGETTVVAAPDTALRDLRRLAADDLLDVAALLVALHAHGPALLGAASLSFADAGTISPVSLGMSGAVRDAVDADAEAVLATCSDDERDESGLAEMGVRLAASNGVAPPVALAGYEVWSGALAHMGLAVVPRERGQGLGRLVAAAAARHAIVADLVPQWRCRLDNTASARVRDRVGFVQHGEQIAIDLASVSPETLTVIDLVHLSRERPGADR